jgi:secreted PhoX family phosphatase
VAPKLFRIGRRSFLRAGAATLSATLLIPDMFDGLVARKALAVPRDRTGFRAGYGSLVPAPDLRDGELRLALPPGFSYRSFGSAGTPMADGYLTPIGHDGMAAFALPNGNIRLVRNHEDKNPPGAGTLDGPAATKYDPAGGGGTTSLEIDPSTRELVADFISLNGTTGNCAGGVTPWDSWLTCEEVVAGPGDGWSQPHGYVYEVSAFATAPVLARPIPAMGRMQLEAAVVDPTTGTVYETEDNAPAGFYRYLPDQPGNLGAGGRLQMLALRGMPRADMATGQMVRVPRPVTWVDIPDPDPAEAARNPRAVAEQGLVEGGAAFTRLEGGWYDSGKVYFTSTDGGEAKLGQVWQFDPVADGLTLIFESPDAAILANPDNLTMSPHGGLVLCEDTQGDQYVRGLTPGGEIFDFALNLTNDSEWAGVCFSPDGETMFVNRQGANRGPNPPAGNDQGMTFAIWGPWLSGPL